MELNGAGATTPYSLYHSLFESYFKKHNVHINYQAVGSGTGIQSLQNHLVDFSASDAFLLDKELFLLDDSVFHIPTCIGAVAIAYNLPIKELKLSPELLDNIFQGQITHWNAPSIQSINPNTRLPKLPIHVIHRSDNSGTTFIFSNYLSKISSSWNNQFSFLQFINWPTGTPARGNEGVASHLKRIKGSISYIDLHMVKKYNIPYALIQNSSGLKPTASSISAAASIKLPYDTRATLTNTSSSYGYPITGFSWILLWQNQSYNDRSLGQAEETLKLLFWLINDAQPLVKDFDFAPIPPSVRKKARKLLHDIHFQNKPILTSK